MKHRRTLLLALMLIAAALVPGAAAGQVRGQVTDAASGDPVGGALVWLAGRTMHMARSDANGAYAFAAVPAGGYCIRVDSPGYEAVGVCITVSAGARMIVDLPVTMRPVAVAPLLVKGRRDIDRGRTGSAEDSLRLTVLEQRLSLLGVRTSALAGAQLGDLTHMPAPDQSAGRRPHALYIWGSNAERGRVLLDGASLSAPLHLGALLPPLDPDVIAGADVHTGGISPRYDGGTSYIMDFTTRPAADELRVWGELDLLAGRIGMEAPINDRGRVIMSGRRVNDEIIDGLISHRFGYGYTDALARADLDVTAASGIHVTAITTSEAVNIPRDLGEDRASWMNRAATLVWRRERADDMESSTLAESATLSLSRGVADLPLLSAPGGHLEASLDRYNALLARRWTAGQLAWEAGAELEHLVFRRRSRATEDPATGEPGYVECTALLPCSHARTTHASVFGELSFDPAHRVSASAGARTMYDVDARRAHLLPRASVTFLPNDRWAVTLAGGRFSQAYVQEERSPEGAAPVDVPIAVGIARATHFELGAARHVAGLGMKAGVYLRHHARIEPARRARTVPGADVALEYGTRLGEMSLAYGISGSTADSAAGAATTQQLATAGFHGTRGRWRFSITAAYGFGLPLTSIVLEHPTDAEAIGQPMSTLQPAADSDAHSSDRSYVRVDAMVGAEWRLGSGERRFVLKPYARIINALSQREALFYYQESGDPRQPPHALARLPAVPMIGLRWTF